MAPVAWSIRQAGLGVLLAKPVSWWIEFLKPREVLGAFPILHHSAPRLRAG